MLHSQCNNTAAAMAIGQRQWRWRCSVCICVYATDLLIFIYFSFVSFRRDHCAVIWTLFTEKKILTGCPRAKIVFSLMPDRILVCTHFKYTVSYFHIFFEVQFFLLVNHKIYDLVSLDRITYTNILYIHSDFRHTHTHQIVRGQKS